MFLAIFFALFLLENVPKPRINKLSPSINVFLIVAIVASTTSCTSDRSTPVWDDTLVIISAFLTFFKIYCLISFLKRKWRNAKDAIAGFIVAVKKAYKKYIESVIIRVIDAVKKAADKGIKFFLEFMDLEINASVSFGKM